MLEVWDFLGQLGISIACGFVIGLERQIHKGLAGIHTNVLVSSGSCLFIFVGLALQDTNSPARIASQIVSGIGFLGAGVIAKEGMTVRGINSAGCYSTSAKSLRALQLMAGGLLSHLARLQARLQRSAALCLFAHCRPSAASSRRRDAGLM
jgi:hypothetical protein